MRLDMAGCIVNCWRARLPARFGDAGNKRLVGHLAEADAADAELTHIAVRTTAQAAAVVAAHLELGRALCFLYQALFCHGFLICAPLRGGKRSLVYPKYHENLLCALVLGFDKMKLSFCLLRLQRPILQYNYVLSQLPQVSLDTFRAFIEYFLVRWCYKSIIS